MLTDSALRQLIADGSIDTVVVCFPDMQGRPVGKRVTAPFFLEHVLEHGIEACDYLLALDVDMEPLPGYRFANWEGGYGDMVALPDLSTLRRVPWLEGTAMVVCDLVGTDGAPVEVSPRRVLSRQIERAAAAGFDVKCATELEFFLFRESFEEAAAKGWRDMHPHTSTIEDYQLLQTSREEYVIRRIRNEMIEAGVPIEFSKGEAGRGQHEINVTYGRALEVADRHLVFKNGVKEIADQCGRAATFMAKWSMAEVGSSCHVHASLWDVSTGAPLMADPVRPSDLSDVGRQFVAGLLLGARQLTWMWAPYVNSYRRYMPGIVGTDGGGVGSGQPHVRIPDRGPRRRLPRRVSGPGSGRQPLSGAGRRHRRRTLGHRARARATGSLFRQRLPGRRRRPDPVHPGRGDRRTRVEHHRSRRLRRRRALPPGQHRPSGVGPGEPGRHRLGAGSQFRANLKPTRASEDAAGGDASVVRP